MVPRVTNRVRGDGQKAVPTAKKKLGWESWSRPKLSCFSTRCYSWPCGKIVEPVSCRATSRADSSAAAAKGRGGVGLWTFVEVLSPGFFRSMAGRTFKSKRDVLDESAGIVVSAPSLSSSTMSVSVVVVFGVIEELIKIIASHSITYPRPILLSPFNVSQPVLPRPSGWRTSTCWINERTPPGRHLVDEVSLKKILSIGRRVPPRGKQGDGTGDNNQRCSRPPIIRAAFVNI